MMRSSTVVFLFCAVLLLPLFQLHAADGTWHRFHLQDINGPVKSIARGPDGEIYVGGSFTEAGGKAASNVARWHNGTWSALANGIWGGTQPVVSALAVTPDGTLYAAGQFTTAGGKTVNNIAAWNGQEWLQVGNGANGRINSLTTGSNGALYAGGQFTTIGGRSASGVARWFNGQWTALGTGVKGGEQVVNAVHFNSGTLYIGGNFTEAGGVEVSHIAAWDGQEWSSPGDGIPEYSAVVHAITTYNGQLYAGGSFVLPGETTTANVRYWNGTTWATHGYFGGPVYALASLGDTLVAGGDFAYASTGAAPSSVVPVSNIVRSVGPGWVSMGKGVDGPVYALAREESAILVGGDFSHVSGTVVHGIARWSAAGWSHISGIPSTSVDGTIHAIAFAPNGHVYVGGSFTTAGSTSANSIARWDGSKWTALGTGINGTVQALAIDSKGIVYAGGDFSTAGGTNANAIARWNGVKWESLNTNASYTRVFALAVNEAGVVYAGGLFTAMGATSASNIARWTGTEWRQMSGGVDGSVNAMAYRNGRLYIGGDFKTTVGGTLNGIAEWDGGQWLPLRNGVEGIVLALAVGPNGRLYAGGDFTIPSRDVTRVGMWDGSQWNTMGTGMNHDVSALSVDSSGVVYAAGLFTMAGGHNTEKIAAWANGEWSALGAGVGGTPVALASSRTMTYVGGNFGMAGGLSSHNLAAWKPCSINAQIAAGGPLSFCQGNSVQLTISGKFDSYLWNTGATTPTITVTESGSYSAIVTDSLGCSASTPIMRVTANTVALQLVSDVAFCAGDSVRLTASGAAMYSWTPSEGLSCTDCAAPFAKPATNTVYTVQATSSAGCTSTATVSVTVNPTPTKPVIDPVGRTLKAWPTASSYQWLRDGAIIPGATEDSYTVPADDGGWFSVRVTNESDCQAVSDSVYLDLATSVGEGDPYSPLLISGSGRAYTVQFTPAAPSSMTLVVADLLGRTVFATQQPAAVQHRVPVDLQSVAPGLYVIHLSTEAARWTRTIVVE